MSLYKIYILYYYYLFNNKYIFLFYNTVNYNLYYIVVEYFKYFGKKSFFFDHIPFNYIVMDYFEKNKI